MAETVGRVDIIADVDGSNLDRQIRALGNKVGAELGKRMSAGAQKELSKLGAELENDMRKNGELAGISFTNSMQRVLRARLGGLSDQIAEAFSGRETLRKFVDELGGVEEGSKKLREQLVELNDKGIVTDKMFNRLMGTLAQSQGQWRAQAREAKELEDSLVDLERASKSYIATQEEEVLNARLNTLAKERMIERNQRLSNAQHAINLELEESSRSFRKVRSDSDDVTKSLDLQTSAWKRLPHGFRQFTFYTGLFAALGEEISILGSVAGSSLTVLAGAAGAAGVGIGTFIAAFQDMMGEISELPAAVQPAATSLQAFTGAFSTLQDAIQIAALSGAAPAFDSLKATVDALTPAFVAMGDVIGRVLDNFAASIAPGTEGFANLATLIAAAAPVFEQLSNAAIIFGDALGDIFVASIPFVQTFVGWIVELATQFSAWTSSLEGQNALKEWFENGLTVMQALEPLIGAVSEALNQLVTPDSVAQFVELLNTVTAFTPALGEILGVIGELDIFGLIADLLDVVFSSIQPIIPALTQMASILSTGLSQAFYTLQPALEAFFVALGPILPVLAQLVITIIESLLPAVIALTPLFQPLADAVLGVLNVITPLIPVLADLVVQIITGLVPVLVPLIESFVNLITIVTPLMPLIVTLIQIALIPLKIIFEGVLPILGALIDLFNQFFAPIVALIQPLVDLAGGWKGLEDNMANFDAQFGGFVDGVVGGINTMIGWIDDAVNAFLGLFGLAADAPSPGSRGNNGGGGSGLAHGGIVHSGRRTLIGESGSEAVVPLNRPLNQVDPSVRALSAFAQGLTGGSGPSKVVNVQPGAIVVNTIAPGSQVANMMLDRLVANVAG